MTSVSSAQFVDHVQHASSTGQGGFRDLVADWDRRVLMATVPRTGRRVAIPFERIRFLEVEPEPLASAAPEPEPPPRAKRHKAVQYR